MIHLHHLGVTLALHPLTRGTGLPLLLLHPLGASAAYWRSLPVAWEGPVYALDFSGHGDSRRLHGGGYSPEYFVADADTALARIGTAAVAGAGLGAYVALLLAGARVDDVVATLLLPGAGLAGGPPQPDFSRPFPLLETDDAPADTDPAVWIADGMVRPPEYALELAEPAGPLLLVEDDDDRPVWWQALRSLRHAVPVSSDLGEAFRRLAEACD